MGIVGITFGPERYFSSPLFSGLDLPDPHFVAFTGLDQPATVNDTTSVFPERRADGGGVDLAVPTEGRYRLMQRSEIAAIGGWVEGVFARLLDDFGRGELIVLEPGGARIGWVRERVRPRVGVSDPFA